MDAGKHDRSVTLLCQTCGGDQFAFEGSGETIQSAKCGSCGREYTKDELIELNSENISEHVKEMGNEITKDFAKEMRETMRKAFRGRKTIKFR